MQTVAVKGYTATGTSSSSSSYQQRHSFYDQPFEDYSCTDLPFLNLFSELFIVPRLFNKELASMEGPQLHKYILQVIHHIAKHHRYLLTEPSNYDTNAFVDRYRKIRNDVFAKTLQEMDQFRTCVRCNRSFTLRNSLGKWKCTRHLNTICRLTNKPVCCLYQSTSESGCIRCDHIDEVYDYLPTVVELPVCLVHCFYPLPCSIVKKEHILSVPNFNPVLGDYVIDASEKSIPGPTCFILTEQPISFSHFHSLR